jgi:lipoyl(octanoyl) transferase
MYGIHFIDLGLKDYKETWDFQNSIQSEMIKTKLSSGRASDSAYLIFVEHPHVFTLGKSGKENNLLIDAKFLESIHASYYRTDRGGDITYHGPGQIVGYPILDLDNMHMGIRKYIDTLEEVVIQTLAEYHLQTDRVNGATGVWTKYPKGDPPRKICAMGVKVSRGITLHGFALNVTTNLKYFSYINPCGFTNKTVTSMEAELGLKPDLTKVKEILLSKFAMQFHINYA